MKYETLVIIALLLITSCKQGTSVKAQQASIPVTDNNISDSRKTAENPAVLLADPKWMPATYRGITLGKSTYKDVKQIFGKPRREGENEDQDFETDDEFETLLQYNNEGVGKEAANILIGEKTKIVKSITYLPYPQTPELEAIAAFGSDYFERETGESMCVWNNSKRGASNRKLQYPVMLVYPEKGMILGIDKDKTVMFVSFPYKCVDQGNSYAVDYIFDKSKNLVE